jgi:hypothetical protein
MLSFIKIHSAVIEIFATADACTYAPTFPQRPVYNVVRIKVHPHPPHQLTCSFLLGGGVGGGSVMVFFYISPSPPQSPLPLSNIASEEEKLRISLFFFNWYKKIEKRTVANLFVHLSGKPGISISVSRYF